VTAPLIAPVIPSSARPAGRGNARPGAARGLPLASQLASPPPPADAVYGIGRIDASGRVGDHAVTCALGWRKGDRLTLTTDAGVVVVARRDPGGLVTVPARACIAIPAALRRRCGLRAGDRVLLAALPGEDALAAYPLAVAVQAIRALGPSPRGAGGQP
jgi:bifunctional DNA-binding transcriptional regulator/antitoxin component of YhaV-PrlF toxin-antitoxin module